MSADLPCFDNRELSWLKFNERVLEEATDRLNPLCEQLSFLSIYQSNLDEFFMVRVGALYDQKLVDPEQRENKTNMTPDEQIAAVYSRVRELTKTKDQVYANLLKRLKKKGISFINFKNIKEEEEAYLHDYFENKLRPLLSPYVIGKKQPFPFLRNKDIYAVVVLRDGEKEKLGIVPCNIGAFERLIRVPTTGRFILCENVIIHYLAEIFKRYKIKSKSLIRTVRSADIDPNEDDYDDNSDFREVMEDLIKQRNRLAPIKLEYNRFLDASAVKVLCANLGMTKDQVFYSKSPLDLRFLSEVRDQLRGRKRLWYPKRRPVLPAWAANGRKMQDLIEEKDRLLSFPYDSIRPFIRLLNEAASDPDVYGIKITLYRVSKNSKIVEALIDAADNGKEVVAVVELRARFDEGNNIEWSRRLEQAGVTVIYGIDHYKVHSKLCQIVRREKTGVRYITQIGTGNYNEITSELYTDLSLMTANQDIGREVAEVFERLCLGETMDHTDVMFIAPNCMQNKIIEKIDGQIARVQAGEEGYIGVKINSFTDKKIMDKMIEASQAGVKIEMVVRGICCLIPGVPGYTENISVRSIVGRYLEHSRIFIFGDEIYIASADFMTRNTVKRVEAATPIYDEEIRSRILKMFRIMLMDDAKARIMNPEGIYEQQSREGKEEFFISQESPFMAYCPPDEPEEDPEDSSAIEPDELAEEITEEVETAEDIEEPEEAEEAEETEEAEDAEEAEETEEPEEAEEVVLPKKKTVWQMDSAETKETTRPDRTPRSNQPGKAEKNSRQIGRKGLLDRLFYRGRHGS